MLHCLVRGKRLRKAGAARRRLPNVGQLGREGKEPVRGCPGNLELVANNHGVRRVGG